MMSTAAILGSGGGEVVNLLACGPTGPGLEFRSQHLNFRDGYILLT